MSDQEHKPQDETEPTETVDGASATESTPAPEATAESVADAAATTDATGAGATEDVPHDDPHHDDPYHHINRVRLDTTYGDIVIELWHNVAPRTADHFLQLVHNGFFDGLSFHRVVPNFLIQAGCPKGDGTGGCGYTVAAEFNDTPHDRGTVSMARRPNEADSASSQFFISLNRENCAHLDGQYTVFGKVLDRCMDTVEQIAQSALTSPELGVPEHPVQIMHCFEDWDDHHAYDHDYHHGMDNPAPEESAAASDTGETGDKPTEA